MGRQEIQFVGNAQPSLLAPIRPVQLYEQIRDQIISQIAVGNWRRGQRLPSERELSLFLGVSRPSVREALAALHLAGIVETRRGSGSWIATDDLTVLRNAATDADSLSPSVSPVALLDVREILEPAAARLAAGIREGDTELQQALDDMDAAGPDLSDPGVRAAWNLGDRRFHRRIAQLTANPVLDEFAGRVFEIMDEPLWRELRDDMLARETRIDTSLAEHHRIYSALVAGDKEVAARESRRHVRQVRRFMGLRQ